VRARSNAVAGRWKASCESVPVIICHHED
jgi:hypothetical protein